MKNITLFFISFLILLLSIGFATGTTYADYNTAQKSCADWREDGTSSIRTHNVAATGNFDPLTFSGTKNFLAGVGVAFQPILFDYSDCGSSMELTTHSGNFLEYYHGANKVLGNVAEISLGYALSTQPLGVDYNNDDIVEYIFANSSDIIVYGGFLINNTAHYGITTGIGCQNMTDNLIHCYFGGNNGGSMLNLTEYTPHNNTLTTHNVSSAGTFSTNVYKASSFAPIIWDWDVDGVAEIFMLCDNDADDNHGVCVYSSQTFTLETSLDDISDGGSVAFQPYIGGMLIDDIDNVGDDEICVTLINNVDVASSDSFLECYNSDGTQFGSSLVVVDDNQVGSSGAVSNPVIATIDGIDNICAVGNVDAGAAIDKVYVRCWNYSAGAFVLTHSLGNEAVGSIGTWWNNGGLIASADLDGDSDDEIITGGAIFDTTGSTFLNYTYDTNVANSVSIADFDDDGFYDIITQTTNVLVYYSSDATGTGGTNNTPPIVYADMWREYDNPICKGSTIIFRALEDTTSNSSYIPYTDGTNYVNDIAEDEILYVDCDGGGAYDGNNTDDNTPSYSCTYNNSGTYYARFCLTDSSNPISVLSANCPIDQYETAIINVIDGIAGTTCNIPGAVEPDTEELTDTTTAAGSGSIEDGANIFMNLISGGNSSAKILIGLIIFIVLLVTVTMSAAKYGVSGSGLAIMVVVLAFVILAVLTKLGIFPVWIILLLVFSLIFLGLLKIGLSQGG